MIEFFQLKFASLYGRPVVRLSRDLQEALVSSDWPGNIRELENTMKRLVVLGDESFILGELARQRTPRPAVHGVSSPSLTPTAIAGASMVPLTPGMPATSADETLGPAPRSQPDYGEEGVTLHELARQAAMVAETDAIQHALDRFRWNRRKAAEHLQVSYKTLLTKMKECGISELSRN